MTFSRQSLDQTLDAARTALLAQRGPGGHWRGQLSSSALATATATGALAVVDRAAHDAVVRRGLQWLAQHANADGGWGDTVDSPSNVAATILARAAFAMGGDEAHPRTIQAAEAWIADRAGGLAAEQIVRVVDARYGADRSFSAPILAMCAIAGLLGPSPQAWRFVAQLPFELAVLPHTLWKRLRLQVVSYALPALIAVGQICHHRRPTLRPLGRFLRGLLRGATLRKLAQTQPESGGFLEATPLTAFVAMSLASAGLADHPVVAGAVRFLRDTVRGDGSWPIDTDLSTWVTTLSINALSVGGERLDDAGVRRWLLDRQLRHEHLYTHAPPGGWAWTDRSGGVPDADDTAGALLALRRAGAIDAEAARSAAAGAGWLADIQNSDGGVPTFCRGWGALPFDRSSSDLTAHALSAWSAWREDLPGPLADRIRRSVPRALDYLRRAQRSDGAWTPLWFGSQSAANEESPVYGTSRVVLALSDLSGEHPAVEPMRRSGVKCLLSAQGRGGGWGGDGSAEPSIEETALAVDALARSAAAGDVAEAVRRGAAWLIERTEGGRRFDAAPIGLYFASLWYSERLYPLIFTVSALARVRQAGL